MSEDSIPDPQVDVDQEIDVPDDEATQAVNDVLETLADAATAQDVAPNVESQEDRGSESKSEEKYHESDAEKGDDSDVASHDSSREKTPSVEITPVKSPEPLSKKDKKKRKKKGSGVLNLKTPKASQVPVLEKKKKKEKKEEKVAASTGRKRKHVSETDSDPDVKQDVPDISTTATKRVKGKRIPLNVPDAPMDSVFPLCRAGLMKTVARIGKCYIQLVREFIVNIPSNCDNEDSAEYRMCLSPDAVTEEEPDLDRVANTLTGKLVKKWPKNGLLPSGKLTAKYDVLYKIGTANWMATQHLSGTLKHAGSFAVKLPIMFPCLLSGLILQQHPTILWADEPLGKKPQPLKFDFRPFAGPHVRDIMFSARGTANASGTKALGSSKEDIVAELQEVSKTLQETIQACKVRKLNVDILMTKKRLKRKLRMQRMKML
ncbi:uncharacterized protein LOC130736439 [Lotus japonicus]|uniref:uncharacterized protein LOC130736439 n=1 Tax=Lotus japonicus TaxID=34305 RepID=UPI00258A57B3|nr:uncharacterized protein LOC130736439 [Lotus japonicus]